MIYFIQADNGLIKIGYTGDIRRRLGQLSHMSPIPLKLLAVREGTMQQEQLLHKIFNNSHGEWFFPEDKLIDYIYDNCKVYD